MSVLPETLHRSWSGLLTQPVLEMLEEIERNLGDNINPERKNVLRFLALDLNAIKVVILGQDPYPEKGVATGRAFEVGTLTSWNEPFRQVSLKNLIRLIYKVYSGIERYEEIPGFSTIKGEIASGAFKLPPPGRLFKSWEEQGVLLLNTYFSVSAGEPGSHRKLWTPFSQNVIQFISTERPDLIWFLWGKPAIENSNYIKDGRIFKSRHPMMTSNLYEDDFLKSSCFKDTMHLIDWTGK